MTRDGDNLPINANKKLMNIFFGDFHAWIEETSERSCLYDPTA